MRIVEANFTVNFEHIGLKFGDSVNSTSILLNFIDKTS